MATSITTSVSDDEGAVTSYSGGPPFVYLTATATEGATELQFETSIISLAAPFTLPSDCLEPVYTPMPVGYDVWDVGGVSRRAKPSCFPPEYSIFQTFTPTSGPLYRTATVFSTGTGAPTVTITRIFFSPARCPPLYTLASRSVLDTATYVTCCPSAFTCTPGNYFCSLDTTAIPGRKVTITDGTSGLTTTEIENATPWYGVYKEADFETITSSSARSTSSTSNDSSSSLSTGAVAGIGVGAALGGILAVVSIVFLLWRRRIKKKHDSADPGPLGESLEKPELPGDGKVLSELNVAQEINEAGGVVKTPEMDHMHVRAELDGNWRGWEAGAQEKRS